MKTKTIELYEFDELPEDVKADVIEKHRDINVDYDWAKWSLEGHEERLEALGFNDPDISFSGFCSQGDGASFTCKSVDLVKFLKGQKALTRFKSLVNMEKSETGEFIASVDRFDHHYCHEHTVKAGVEVNWFDDEEQEIQEGLSKMGDELQTLITETVRTLSKKIYRELESEYEYLTSDEEIIETLKANEYTFTASGRMES